MLVQEQLAKVIADQKALVDNFGRLSDTVSKQQHKAELDERMRHSSEQVQQLTRVVEGLAAKSTSQPSERLVDELREKDREIKRLSGIIEKAVESQIKQPREAPKSIDLVGQELAITLRDSATPQAFFPLPSPSAPPALLSEAETPRSNPFDRRAYQTRMIHDKIDFARAAGFQFGAGPHQGLHWQERRPVVRSPLRYPCHQTTWWNMDRHKNDRGVHLSTTPS